MEDKHKYYQDGKYIICLDCGATATSIADVQHFDTCVPGSSDEWIKYYEEG